MTLFFIALGGLTLFLLYKISCRITAQESVLAGKTIQLFESLQLVDSTVNIRVFNERMQFSLGVISEFADVKDMRMLARAMRKGCENYHRLYPNVALTHSQSLLRDNVLNIADKGYITERINAFFTRFCERMASEINNLKTTAAKDRRRSEVDECLRICRQTTQMLGMPNAVEALDYIARPIFS